MTDPTRCPESYAGESRSGRSSCKHLLLFKTLSTTRWILWENSPSATLLTAKRETQRLHTQRKRVHMVKSNIIFKLSWIEDWVRLLTFTSHLQQRGRPSGCTLSRTTCRCFVRGWNRWTGHSHSPCVVSGTLQQQKKQIHCFFCWFFVVVFP